MELHYLTLKRQIEQIKKSVIGGKIAASFTRHKNEQIVQIESPAGQVIQLQISTDAGYPFILLREPSRRARLSTDVVTELKGQHIANVSLMRGERVVVIEFSESDFRYYVQLFRNRANCFLIGSSEKIINAFKQQKKYAGKLYRLRKENRYDSLHINSEQFFKQIRCGEEDAPLNFILKRRFMYLTPLVIRELAFRCKMDVKQFASRIPENLLINFYREMQSFLNACLEDNPRIYLNADYPVTFSLTNLRMFEDMDYREFETINDALVFFVFRRKKMDQYQQKKQKIETLLDRKSKQISNVIKQIQNIPDEEEQKSYYQKIGKLLLAQMHKIPLQKEEVELIDYFDPDQRSICVRLKPGLSVQENAEYYFEKAKESSLRRKKLEARLIYQNKQQRELEKIKKSLDNSLNYKKFNQIEKQLTEMHILQTAPDKLEEAYRPYKRYYYDIWEIWVGKNSKANDAMTFRYAHKEDIWMHAQGASGSHVVVRNPGRKQQIPKQVLEYAAQLATRNSNAKHSSYVPVIVTRVKYVRKPRGSAPGAVLPERTKTLFVEPL